MQGLLAAVASVVVAAAAVVAGRPVGCTFESHHSWVHLVESVLPAVLRIWAE